MAQERLAFTRPAAERIARAVRIVEAGNRDSQGLRFDKVLGAAAGSPLRLATFTGNWATGQYKTVTLNGSTATASVYNWCNSSTGANTASSTESRYVIFGTVQGTNSVVEIQLGVPTAATCRMTIGELDTRTLPGYSAGTIQLLGHSAADLTTNATACATLTWYSVTTCSTATGS